MRAMCRKDGWKVFGECDVCDKRLERRYRNIPGTGSYREMGLYCAEHGLMLPETVLMRQRIWITDMDQL